MVRKGSPVRVRERAWSDRAWGGAVGTRSRRGRMETFRKPRGYPEPSGAELRDLLGPRAISVRTVDAGLSAQNVPTSFAQASLPRSWVSSTCGIGAASDGRTYSASNASAAARSSLRVVAWAAPQEAAGPDGYPPAAHGFGVFAQRSAWSVSVVTGLSGRSVLVPLPQKRPRRV